MAAAAGTTGARGQPTPSSSSGASPLLRVGSAWRRLSEHVSERVVAPNARKVELEAAKVGAMLRRVRRALRARARAPAAMPLAYVSAPDASHPHNLPRFAPSLPAKEKEALRLEIAARLKGVKVHSVVNSSNEFVMVSSEHEPEKRICLLFFNRKDADELMEKIKKDRETKDVKVVSVGLDKAYQFACEAATEFGPETAFRFLPDRREVYNAIKVHQSAGHRTDRLVGVPVFQAEGLTITTEQGKQKRSVLPLFFTRKDLDIAMHAAFKENAYRRTVEVGVLEDLLTKMESPGHRRWRNVVFIPPGAAEAMFAAQLDEQ